MFYRHWEHIKFARSGKLFRYPKKDFGSTRNNVHNHHGCPLNDIMKGIFFSGNDEVAMGYVTLSSPFGNTRWMKPLSAFLPENGHKYYFADFYCNKTGTVHYILIGITKLDTIEDLFCQRSLLQIDPRDNNFFIFDSDGSGRCVNKVWVNFFYMADLFIGDGVNLYFNHDITHYLMSNHMEYFMEVQHMTRVS